MLIITTGYWRYYDRRVHWSVKVEINTIYTTGLLTSGPSSSSSWLLVAFAFLPLLAYTYALSRRVEVLEAVCLVCIHVCRGGCGVSWVDTSTSSSATYLSLTLTETASTPFSNQHIPNAHLPIRLSMWPWQQVTSKPYVVDFTCSDVIIVWPVCVRVLCFRVIWCIPERRDWLKIG